MNVDNIALYIGVGIMAIERLALWPLANSEAAFALGLGLAIVPAYKTISDIIFDIISDIIST